MRATMTDYTAFLKKVAEVTHIEAFAKADEAGLVSLTVDEDYALNLQFVEASGKIFCFAPVCELPAEAGVEAYRALLAANLFGVEGAGGTFSLERESNTVVYSLLVDLTPELEAERFVRTLEQVLELVKMWAEKLLGELAPAAEEKVDFTSVPDPRFLV